MSQASTTPDESETQAITTTALPIVASTSTTNNTSEQQSDENAIAEGEEDWEDVQEEIDTDDESGEEEDPMTSQQYLAKAKKWKLKKGNIFQTPFDTFDYGDGFQPRTLKEMKLVAFMQAIRFKPDWMAKISDESIVERWRQEAAEQKLSKALFKYGIAELRHIKSLAEASIIIPSTVDGVWQADGLIEPELSKELLNNVQELEQVPDLLKDWHPGSNQQVLDLVHPSLFCLINKVSRVCNKPVYLPDMASGGEIVDFAQLAPKNCDPKTFSNSYQWLPSDFDVSPEGKVKILSYINNLHPANHGPLYKTLEKIFEKFVPMFENVLTDALAERPVRIPQYNDWWETERDCDVEEDTRPLYLPPTPKFAPLPTIPEDDKFSLRGRKLQVIVKLANIELTPDKPRYAGGSWHVEGMLNERIVASGIYYYKSENISESLLAFRAPICEPEYEQNDNRGVQGVFGLEDDDALNQSWGAVLTKENRCIVFPNILQHHVDPFHLIDESRPGSRKILVFFLVDPTQVITSTATVTPLQKEWYQRTLHSIGGLFSTLPGELIDYIGSFSKETLTLSEAKSHREALMKERKYFTQVNNQEAYERPFSLCEH